ncbi:MAG: aldehyde ferredoxin oxidoreductase C-terminal domain-containing protein [Candidatus Moduliflexus flocculans]|nr:aldehyde ferredoxin oxidoreductase C-terminal domain-containing protein [Candidatus Moduliflexus flocculans]
MRLSATAMKRKGPEYETMVGFGREPVDRRFERSRLRTWANCATRYGMDTISTANTIGLAFHLYEMGKVTKQDTGGIELNWGDVDAVQQLMRPDRPPRGTRRTAVTAVHVSLARRFGAEEEAVQVNGLEVAYHDPRGVSGMALSYATSPRGACHNQSDYFFVDWGHTNEQTRHRILRPSCAGGESPRMWRSTRIGARSSTPS